ncbi:LacI family DNA-binding transcriptional regulator [Nocardioides sp. NPDC126508]
MTGSEPERRVRPGIKDVARRAGVSATTVSHTFSGKGTVAPATRERVRSAASELGYRPDVLARSLRSSRLGVIALVLRTLEGGSSLPEGIDYVLEFAGAAAVNAMRHGYGLMLVADPTSDGAPSTALACDGFIVTEPLRADPLVTVLQQDGLPYLTVGRVPDIDEAPALDIFTRSITRRVLDFLRERGARRIALITSETPNAWYLDTETTYAAWAAEHGAPPLISRQPERREAAGGAAAVDELLAASPDLDAVYCLTGPHAAGAQARLQALGRRVPDDVQLLCGSDSSHLRASEPRISAVDLQPQLLAELAVTRLVNMLDGTAHPEPADLATGRIVARGSTRDR